MPAIDFYNVQIRRCVIAKPRYGYETKSLSDNKSVVGENFQHALNMSQGFSTYSKEAANPWLLILLLCHLKVTIQAINCNYPAI